MSEYILTRLRSSARFALDRSRGEGSLRNSDVVGRLREILIDQSLRPWLPPYVSCGTGIIIDDDSDPAQIPPQNDVVVYDRSLVPPVLASESTPDGVFPSNGVLVRIEVKSTLTRGDLEGFVASSQRIARLRFQYSANSPLTSR